MLIINEKYAIKNDGLCYAICEPRKRKGIVGYEPKWYLNTLSQAVNFLIDRDVDIPDTLKGLSDNIESLKNDIQTSLSGKGLIGDGDQILKDIP